MGYIDRIFYIILAALLLTFVTAQQQVFANCAQPCDDAHIPPTDMKTDPQSPQNSGPPLTDKQFKNPKDIKIPGQNKCQTLDGFSASEPCPSGSHSGGGSKHHGGSSLSGAGSSKHGGLIQLPSNRSDFSNGDTSAIPFGIRS